MLLLAVASMVLVDGPYGTKDRCERTLPEPKTVSVSCVLLEAAPPPINDVEMDFYQAQWRGRGWYVVIRK